MALGHLNKNSSCTIDYSQQPRLIIVTSLYWLLVLQTELAA